MRGLVRAVLLLAATAAAAQPGFLEVSGPFRHPSGMIFPERYGDFRRKAVVGFAWAKDSYNIAYVTPKDEILVSVTVYSLPDETLDVHFERILRDVARMHRGGAKLVEQGTVHIKQPPETIEGRSAKWQIDDTPALSQRAYLFRRGDWFVKYSVVYPKTMDDAVRGSVLRLITALRMPAAAKVAEAGTPGPLGTKVLPACARKDS